ncbi:MAG: hypothetical protein IPG39_19510 [Bacteroidetes bacterium]|nr:hypothetical protein [Bacteroidota bacterium]
MPLVSLSLLCLGSGSHAGVPDIVHDRGLNLKLDWTKKCKAYGDAKITFTPKENTNAVLLDAADLEIFAVTENNKKLSFNILLRRIQTESKFCLQEKLLKTILLPFKFLTALNMKNKSDLVV